MADLPESTPNWKRKQLLDGALYEMRDYFNAHKAVPLITIGLVITGDKRGGGVIHGPSLTTAEVIKSLRNALDKLEEMNRGDDRYKEGGT